MADRGSAVEGSSYSNFAGIFLFVVGLFNILDGVIMLWRKEYFADASVVVQPTCRPGAGSSSSSASSRCSPAGSS